MNEIDAPAGREVHLHARVRRQRFLAIAAAAAAAVAVGVVAGLPAWLNGGPARHSPAAAPAPSPTDDVRAQTAGCADAVPPPTAYATQPANQTALDDVAQRIYRHVQARFVDVFTGLEMRQEADAVRVYSKPSAAFDAWILDTFADQCVEVAEARYSAPELQAFVDQVEADRSHWKARGIQLNTVSVSMDGTVTLGVDPERVEAARREIPSRYPFRVLIVAEGPIALLNARPGTGT
jgi:hypothetical protein